MVTLMAREPAARPYLALGRRIASARRAAGLTQRQFAQRVGISEGYPNQIEQGRNRPDTDLLQTIARVLSLEYNEMGALAGYLRPAPDDEPVDIEDPELDLMFRQPKPS
jgi:transcriptional regulator with XRE-family HTH domain